MKADFMKSQVQSNYLKLMTRSKTHYILPKARITIIKQSKAYDKANSNNMMRENLLAKCIKKNLTYRKLQKIKQPDNPLLNLKNKKTYK